MPALVGPILGRPQRSLEPSEDEERGGDARGDQTAREPDQAQRSVATLVLQQTLRFGGSVDAARQLAVHGVGLGECERTAAERRDRDAGCDVRYRPLRAAGPGSRLWNGAAVDTAATGACLSGTAAGSSSAVERSPWPPSRQRWGPSALPEKASLSPARWGAARRQETCPVWGAAAVDPPGCWPPGPR